MTFRQLNEYLKNCGVNIKRVVENLKYIGSRSESDTELDDRNLRFKVIARLISGLNDIQYWMSSLIAQCPHGDVWERHEFDPEIGGPVWYVP